MMTYEDECKAILMDAITAIGDRIAEMAKATTPELDAISTPCAVLCDLQSCMMNWLYCANSREE